MLLFVVFLGGVFVVVDIGFVYVCVCTCTVWMWMYVHVCLCTYSMCVHKYHLAMTRHTLKHGLIRPSFQCAPHRQHRHCTCLYFYTHLLSCRGRGWDRARLIRGECILQPLQQLVLKLAHVLQTSRSTRKGLFLLLIISNNSNDGNWKSPTPRFKAQNKHKITTVMHTKTDNDPCNLTNS